MTKLLELFETDLKAAIKILQWAFMDEIKTNETRENLIKKGKFQQIENINKIPMNILFLKILFIYLFI